MSQKSIFATVVICTCNRSASLRSTLISLAGIALPNGFNAELILVDNGSNDETRSVAKEYCAPHLPMTYLFEPKRGQVHARNAALRVARGEVVLFTDDDVRVPIDWIEKMSAPILSGETDAIAGGVRIPKHLERSWMTTHHRSWLAETDWLNEVQDVEMIGANMGFSRKVLELVPWFDPELGPGALGFGDDSLFSWQVKIANFRMEKRLHIEVEHHYDPGRLVRASLLAQAMARGKTQAYITHHWKHEVISAPAAKLAKSMVRLSRRRIKEPPGSGRAEGTPDWEMLLLRDVYFYRHYLEICRSQRNYDRMGLAKKHASE